MSEMAKVVLRVDDMTCGHCVKSITQAIQDVIPNVQVDANLTTHLITVSGTDDAQTIKKAIIAADYTPQIV